MARHHVMRTFLALLTVAALATGTVLTVGSLSAQPAPAPSATHTSPKGYTINAPGGWETVSGELDPEQLAKLPTNIREQYDPKTTDVMFMDLSAKRDSEFNDNLNIVVLDEPVPVTDELINDLKNILTDQYQMLFDNFELKSFGKTTFGSNDAIRIEATYTLLGYNLVLYQALMSSDNKALVLTCTMDEARKEERMKLCSETFGSVQFK